MSGPVGLHGRSLVGSPLIWLASALRGLALSLGHLSPVRRHGYRCSQVNLEEKDMFTFWSCASHVNNLSGHITVSDDQSSRSSPQLHYMSHSLDPAQMWLQYKWKLFSHIFTKVNRLEFLVLKILSYSKVHCFHISTLLCCFTITEPDCETLQWQQNLNAMNLYKVTEDTATSHLTNRSKKQLQNSK